ncbi:uncharacterized protein LOC143078672 isoform X2 [Mytilus galloprovincialis]|uniref:uncharacterized protein LOC143078672 isoform X2 n=1 Tax=Mytilus galloprovincialis TaxID=29158 RepID=UPI003F7BAFFC
MSVNTFTLFVVLPDDSVCTLRNLVSGVNIEEIKARLELIAGLPSHIFILIYPDGEKLQDHQKLLMRENIKDGYVLRVHVIEHWETLFNSVFRNNIESVYHNGGVHLKGNMVINAEESGKIENAVYDRGCVALYMSSFLGLLRMCNMLITVGVDINGTTQFGRTALHAAASKDNLITLKYLIDHGAKINITDLLGKSPLDVAQSCASLMCEKNLKIMQLNLRGNNKMAKNPKAIYNTLQLSDKKLVKINKDQTIRPKSLVESRITINDDSQKTRPHTHYTPRQTLGKSPKGPRTVAWVSIQDSKVNRNIGKTPSYHKFENVTKMKTLDENAVTCKPLPLLKKKSCLKFTPGADEKAISRSTQTTPVASKTDVSTTPMLFAPPSSRLDGSTVADEMNTSFSTEDRAVSARTRSSKSGKLVSFSHKERPEFPDFTESSRVMKRRINLAANRSAQPTDQRETSTPKRSGVIHDRWADRKKVFNKNVRQDISSSDDDDSDFDDDDSGNGSEANAEAYEAWLKRKELESKRMPRKVTRPIHDIIKIGSTEVGDGRNPPAEHNITAYRDWFERRKTNKRTPNLERIKSMKDFMSQKKMLEEKRQKLLMTAISYDEWMDQEYDRRALIRKILQADYEQLKVMEQENDRNPAPVQNVNTKWQEEVMKREEMERKRRLIQQSYSEEKEKWRKEIMKNSTAVSQNDWLRGKNPQTPRLLMRSNSKGAPGSDVKRAVEADKAYQDWMKRKHSEDISDIQRQVETERDMLHSCRQRRTAQVISC